MCKTNKQEVTGSNVKRFTVRCFPSVRCAGLGSLASLLLLAQYDADDVVLLHVLHQLFFIGGLEAADAAAEKKHAVLHAGCRKPGASFPHRYSQRSGT